MEKKVYQEISSLVDVIKRCQDTESHEWTQKYMERLENIENNHLPHGSGIDNGCSVLVHDSTSEKIVIKSAFHIMDSNGYYCEWIAFTVTIRASLQFGIDLKIVGQFGKKNQDLKDNLYESFDYCLREEITV